MDFPYTKYGIVVPPLEVELEQPMQEGGRIDDGEVLQVVQGTVAA